MPEHEHERPKRLSLSEILEMVLSRGAAAGASSVTLTLNAKGETQIEVTVRTGEDGIETVDDAQAKAAAVYAQLREAYPPAPPSEYATVALTRNAKGETQIEVSVRATEGQTPTSTADAAASIYKTLRGRFPTSEGTVSRA